MVFEGYVVELYFVVERVDVLRISWFDDFVFGIEYGVDALERGKSFLYAVASAREFFERVYNAVENDEVVDKFGSSDASVARED